MTESKQNPSVPGEQDSPDESFMSIHRRVRDAHVVEYRKDFMKLQNRLYDFKIGLIRKLRGVIHI